MKSRALLLAALTFIACRAAESPEQQAARMQADADSARAAIQEGNARWVRYVNAGQPESLATLYVADGMVMPNDAPAATGRDSIVARVRPLIVPGGTLTITTQSVAASGPMATDRGIFTYTAPARGRTPAVNLRGKFLAHWHKTADGWRIVENIWNTDTPTPPMPAAR